LRRCGFSQNITVCLLLGDLFNRGGGARNHI